MERGARLILLLLVSSSLLAGCLKRGGDEPLDTAANETGPLVDAPEGRGPIVAFEETNKTEAGAGGLEHDHDYWQGRARAPLLEKVATLPIATDGETAREVRPDEGALVYEGAALVEVTLSKPRRLDAADPSNPAPPMLYYRHAASSEWIQVGQPAWDTPTAIKINDPAETDMPHATWSLWDFRFVSAEPSAYTLSFDVKADAVRGDDSIPKWPGHPDFYADVDQRRVLDVDAHSAQNGLTGDLLPVEEADGTVAPEKVVSYGTRTLYVFLNVTSFENPSPLDKPTNFFLWFHNASGIWNTTNIFDPVNHSAEKKEHVFVLKVTDGGMDSPYAPASRWGFEMGAAFLQGADGIFQISCYSGCATWSADYHLTVIATPEELADDAYDAIA